MFKSMFLAYIIKLKIKIKENVYIQRFINKVFGWFWALTPRTHTHTPKSGTCSTFCSIEQIDR